MNTRLNHIQNWPELARQANWSVAVLAMQCRVSKRTLHRHFLKHMGRSPKAWLIEERQRSALELLRNGSTIKEIATWLGYKQPGNFTRQYKSLWGVCPSLQTPAMGPPGPQTSELIETFPN